MLLTQYYPNHYTDINMVKICRKYISLVRFLDLWATYQTIAEINGHKFEIK